MARTARSLHARKKRRKVLDQAKGYRGTKHTSYKRAKEQIWKSGVYAYEGRKQRKRDFRSLWIQRINAGAREHGLSYSQFVHGLRVAEIDLDRKVLADLAATEPEAFAAIVAQAKNALDGQPVERRIEVDRRRAEEAPQARQKPKRSKPEPETTAPEPQEDTDVEATGAAERRAEELDVDLQSVEGSGAEGRVVAGDVEEVAEEKGKVHATEAAERKAVELGVDLGSVEGTGKDGRITVGDVIRPPKRRPPTSNRRTPGERQLSLKRAGRLKQKKHREAEPLFLAEGANLILESREPPRRLFSDPEDVVASRRSLPRPGRSGCFLSRRNPGRVAGGLPTRRAVARRAGPRERRHRHPLGPRLRGGCRPLAGLRRPVQPQDRPRYYGLTLPRSGLARTGLARVPGGGSWLRFRHRGRCPCGGRRPRPLPEAGSL